MTSLSSHASRSPVQRAINAGLMLLAACVMLVGCITLWQSYRLPSLGLAWTLDEGRVTVIEPGGPADGLLRPNDRLLTLNGLSFVGGGDMQALIHAVRPGHPAQLRIERDGAEHTVTIIPAVMPPSLEGHLIDYVAGVLLCLVGLYVLVNQRSSLTARLFLLFSMLAAAVMWGNNSLFIDPGYAAVRRLAMSVIAPCLFVSLVISLPYDRLAAGPLRGPRRAYCLLSLLLGIAGAISALFMTNWSYELYLLILANQPLGVVVASYLTIRVYRQLPPGADRDRYRTAVAVFVAGLLPSAVAVGLGFSRAWLNYDVRIVTISTFTIPVALAYVVARYRFLGARMLARQGTALALLLGTTLAILAGIYLLAFYAIDPFIPQQAPELALLVAAIVTAALFEPLRRRIWRLVTHTLNARRRELYEALGAFSHDLITLQDLSALLQALTHRLQALFPSTCLVIILRQDERQYHVAQAVGCPHVNPGLVFSPQDPLGQWLLQDQGLFASQRPLDTRALAPAEQRLINDVQPEIIIALPAREGMPLGWLVLGPQSGRSGYDTWEIDLLTSLTNQASVAIANAQLYDQTARMVRELQETNRQLEALQETSVSLTQRLALADAAQHVVQGVLSTRSYSMALLGVANEAQTAIDIVAYADADPARHAQLQEVFGASGQGAQLDLLGPANLAIQAIRQRRVLKTQDSRGIAGPTWGFDAAGNPARSDRGEQISQRQTYVLAPLYLGDTLKGLVLAGTERPDVSDYEIDLLSTFGHQAVLALENARLWQQTDAEVHQQLRELTIIHDLTQDINRTLELNVVLDRALSHLLAGTCFDMGLVSLINDDKTVTPVINHGIPTTLYTQPPETLRVEARRVLQTHQAIIVQDTQAVPDLHDQEIRAYGFWPLVSKEKTLGLLVLGSRREPPLPDPDVQLPGAVAQQMGIAITNARLYANVVQERQKTETILQNIGDGVCTVGPDRVLRTWNPAAERLLGYRDHQAIGQPCADILRCHDGEDNPLCDTGCPLTIAWQEQRDTYSYLGTIFMRASDGASIPVLSVTSPLPSPGDAAPDDAAPGGIIAWRDASYEAEMERLENEFLSMISHEIRTPLTNLKAAAQTFVRLNRQSDPELSLDLARIISEQCDRLCQLVEKVEDTAHLPNHSTAVATPLFLPTLIRQLAQAFQLSEQHRTFQLDLTDEPALWGLVNQVEFSRVLNSLLDNAVKYSHPQGTITIQARAGATDEILVAVLDQGPVIPTKQRERIFDRFYRVDNSDARTVYGLGLGLYVARGLVNGWGGQIWVDEHEQMGNRFHFTIPHTERATPA